MTRKVFDYPSGIYQIRNLINGKIYIGQSVRLVDRRYNHFRLLELGQSHAHHLQNSYNKYGRENFVFEVLMYCDIDSLDFYEQFFVDNLKPQYNIRTEVTSNRGHKVSEETKHKLRLSNLGKKRSTAARLNMSKAHETRTVYMSENAKKSQSERMKMGKGFHPLSKLTPDDIRQIRKMRYELDISCIKIGNIFNVDRTVIYNICTGRTWSHVK